jgi:hypothetical protein
MADDDSGETQDLRSGSEVSQDDDEESEGGKIKRKRRAPNEEMSVDLTTGNDDEYGPQWNPYLGARLDFNLAMRQIMNKCWDLESVGPPGQDLDSIQKSRALIKQHPMWSASKYVDSPYTMKYFMQSLTEKVPLLVLLLLLLLLL